MSLAYKCDVCGKLIPQKLLLELACRVLNSDENPEQQAVEEIYGQYCDGCIASGTAIEDLVAQLTKYRGLEAEKLVVVEEKTPELVQP